MSCQLVTATEPFTTIFEITNVWFFTCVSSHVTSLMLEPMKGSLAEGTDVRPWSIPTVSFAGGLSHGFPFFFLTVLVGCGL